jgi:hypothetical protein
MIGFESHICVEAVCAIPMQEIGGKYFFEYLCVQQSAIMQYNKHIFKDNQVMINNDHYTAITN